MATKKEKSSALSTEIVRTAGKIADLCSGIPVLDAMERVYRLTASSDAVQIFMLRFLPWQHENLIATAEIIKEINKRRGLKEDFMPPMAPRYLLPYLDHASQEDDRNIQEMWAALYANHIDPERRQPIRKMYLRVLASFDPIDVAVIKIIGKADEDGKPSESIDGNVLLKSLNMSDEEIELSLTNLSQVGCLLKRANQASLLLGSSLPNPWSISTKEAKYSLTALGREILVACSP